MISTIFTANSGSLNNGSAWVNRPHPGARPAKPIARLLPPAAGELVGHVVRLRREPAKMAAMDLLVHSAYLGGRMLSNEVRRLPSGELCDRISKWKRQEAAENAKCYAKHGVDHLWFADPATKTVDVLALDGATYRVIQSASNDKRVRLRPFTKQIDLAKLWKR